MSVIANTTPFDKLKAHIALHMPDVSDIYAERYENNKSMSEIGKTSNKSLQTVRNKLISIWSLLESDAPQLIKEAQAYAVNTEGARNIVRDLESYTGRHVLIHSHLGGHDKPMHFNVGKRNNLNLLSDVKHALISHQDKTPAEQIYAAFKVAGNKGAIAIARFGIRRDKSMTLDDLGRKYKLTRERIRQISSFMAKILYVAEMEAKTGPLGILLQCIESTFAPGGGTIDRVHKVMESAGISDISEDGMVYLLHGIGIENVAMRLDPYIHDPLMTPEQVSKEIKARDRYHKIKSLADKNAGKKSHQILLRCLPNLINNLDLAISIAGQGKISRGDYISARITKETLKDAPVEEVQWKDTDWTTRSVKISGALFDAISEVAAQRGVTKTALLNAGIKAISKPS